MAKLQSYQHEFFAQAVETYKEALAVKLKVFGPEHVSTAMTLVNIGAVYKQQGDIPRALDYFARALTARTKALGPTHADTAIAVTNIADLHRLSGDHDLALQYYSWALDIREQVLGKHTHTADTIYNIALVHKRLGMFAFVLRLCFPHIRCHRKP